MALVALLSASVLAACGSDSGSGTSSTPAATSGTTTGGATSDATPAATGPLDTVTWNLPLGEPQGLDVQIPNTDYSLTALPAVCESLQRRDPETGELQPALAESTEFPDETTVVYNLRPNVKFTDGKPLTPADVVFNLQRSTKIFPLTWTYLESIKATGPMQVTVKFSKPNIIFRQSASVAIIGGVTEKAAAIAGGKAYGTASSPTVCTGPYKVDKWEPGRQIELVPNPDYWDTAHMPKVKRLIFTFVTDNSAIVAGLSSGQFDGAQFLPATTVGGLKSASNGSLLIGDGAETHFILPLGGSMKSAEIRRALSLSIDRAGIAKAAFADTAEPALGLYVPWSWGYEQEKFQAAWDASPVKATDADAAKAAFEQAGSPTTPIRIGINGADQTAVREASIIQSGAKKIGLNVQIVSLPNDRYQGIYVDPAARKGLDAALEFTDYNVKDPAEGANFWFPSSSPFNYIGYKNASVDKNMLDQVSETDEATRAQMLIDAQNQALYQDWVIIPTVTLKTVSFVKKGIGGYKASWDNRYFPWAASLGATG